MIAYEMLLRKAGAARGARRIFVQPPPFSAEIREQLLDTYRDDILRLQDLIGRDLSRWLGGAQG